MLTDFKMANTAVKIVLQKIFVGKRLLKYDHYSSIYMTPLTVL